MPVEFPCPSCQARLRVQENAVGKRVRCPRCGDIAPSAPQKDSVLPKELNRLAPLDKWSMKTNDGNVYGPVEKNELDNWVLEGRIDARCQVIREGTDRWQWASDVYPQLRPQVLAATGQTALPPRSINDRPLNGHRNNGNGNGNGHVPMATLSMNPGQSQGRRRRFLPRRRSTRSRTTAGLLGILLGAFGVHRIYLGYIVIGLLQLIVTLMTMGLGALWGIIEGALILGGGFDRDADGALME